MYKIIALIGKAGAGKDTILNKFCDKYGDDFNKIISCTTRPPRDYEVDGVDYHFLTNIEFLEKIANGDMLEATEFRDWFYGTAASSLKEDKINIGVFNVEGLNNLVETATVDKNIKVFAFDIYAPDKERLERQLLREKNPNCSEICRRFLADEKDFKDFYENGIQDFVMINNSNTSSIDEICNSMAKIIKDI